MLTLPSGVGRSAPDPGKTLRMLLFRGAGSDLSEADRCSRCCARTCTRHTWTPGAATRSRS